VAAFDHHRLRELRAEIAVRPELTEKGLAQGLRVLLRFGVRLLDLGAAALDRGTGQFHPRFSGEAAGDEEGWIVHIDLNVLAARVERLLKRQREVQREQAL